MQLLLILGLLIASLAIIFAVQNNIPTAVHFFTWEIQGSLAIILLIALAVGVLISFLVSTPTVIKDKLTIRSQRIKMKDLEAELNEKRTSLEEAQKEIDEKDKAISQQSVESEAGYKQTSQLEDSS